MLNQQTIDKLHTMKLHGIADAFRAQLETTEAAQLSFEERFALLVDQQWLWKENRALSRLSWKWRERSPVKITERTREETTKALHRRRESRHPEAAFAGTGAGLETV